MGGPRRAGPAAEVAHGMSAYYEDAEGRMWEAFGPLGPDGDYLLTRVAPYAPPVPGVADWRAARTATEDDLGAMTFVGPP